MSTPGATRWLTSHFWADYHEYADQGHWLALSGQASKLAGDLHRWLIKSLGEPLLVPDEDEE